MESEKYLKKHKNHSNNSVNKEFTPIILVKEISQIQSIRYFTKEFSNKNSIR